MAIYDAEEHNLPRFCEGDIYGFSVLTNPNTNDIDEVANVWPYIDNETLQEAYFQEGHAGGIIAEGAVGMAPNSNLLWCRWPAEMADRQAQADPNSYNLSHTPKRPTIYKYQWYDPDDREIKNSNKITMSSAFHECYYIDKYGKLKALGTAYDFKPAMMRMFGGNGPVLHQGADPRIFELWQADPDGYGYNSSLNLVHVCCAADETIITLDDNGSVRIVQAGVPGVALEAMGGNDDHLVVYFDKEDIEDHFWIDDEGNNVFLNEGFVDCWASGGGTPGQGVVVWALHKSGRLYGQHIHNMFWRDRDYIHRNPDTGEPYDIARGKSMPEPYMIHPLDEEGTPGPEEINLYRGARRYGTQIINETLDRYGYRSYRFHGSVAHFEGVEQWFDFSMEEEIIPDPCHTGGISPWWNNTSIKHALNQIPKNNNGNRYKVTSLYDGYGHGGGCLCVDPDLPAGNGIIIDQKVEPILLNSWSQSIHRHMYEHVHTLKKYRAIKDTLEVGGWRYEINNQGAFAFDVLLYDLLFKDLNTGTYKPPIKFSSNRRAFCFITNNGRVAVFQGAGPGNITNPLINYRLNADDELEPILNHNHDSGGYEGNWFFNYDGSYGGDNGDMIRWHCNYGQDDGAGPDRGPHMIVGNQNGPQLKGRFGFGHMPPDETGKYPGIDDNPWHILAEMENFSIYSFHYFPYIKYLGYDHEDYYWNMDSLIYLNSIEDEQGRTIRTHPDTFHKGHSAIHVFWVGEGSPYAPFDTNPVMWWSAQGDNINAVFKNGVVDSCTFFQDQMSSFCWPPITQPLEQLDEPQQTPTPTPTPTPTLTPTPTPTPTQEGGGRGEGEGGGGGEMPITWITPPQLVDGTELGSYTEQIEATYAAAQGGTAPPIDTPVDSYVILGGDFPTGLNFNEGSGAISGTVPELDSFVAEFQNPPPDGVTIPAPFIEQGFVPAFGSFGSSALTDGTNTVPYPVTFTVGAVIAGEVQDTQDYTINIMNNWTSDRNHFVSSVFGPDVLQQLINDYWGG